MFIEATKKLAKRNSLKANAISVVTAVSLSLLQLQYSEIFQHANFLLFYPFAFLIAWSLGFYPALVYIFLSTISSAYIFHYQLETILDFNRLLVYFVSTTGLAYMISKSVELVLKERDDKKLAYDDLKMKSQELMDFYNNAPIGFHVVDTEGKIIFINQAECTWLGYQAEELIGKHVSHILNIDFVAVAAERLSRLEENRKFENIEISLMTKKGDIVNCLVNTLGVFDSHGKLTHARSSVVNITEKIKEDNRLRVLSLAVDQSPLSIEVVNSKIEIEYVNEQFLKNCGYKWEEIKGLNPKFLSAGVTPKSTFEEMWIKLKDGIPWTGELVNRRKNGELYTEKTYIAPVFNEKKELMNYIALKEDITLKKRQESLIEEQRKKLIKSDQIFTNITKNIPGVIYIFKKNADQSMNFVYASEGIFDFLGEKLETLQKDGSAGFAHTHSEDVQKLIDSINYSEAHQVHWNLEFRVNHPLRGLIWIAGQSSPEKMPDGSTIWYGNLMDITEKKKQEELINNQQRVIFDTSRMMAIGDMASSMAHEINNPLTVIYNKIKKIKRLTNETDHQFIRDLEKIESSTERIAKIVKALKSISMDPHVETESKSVLDVDQLMRDLLDFSGEKIRNHRIKIELQCPQHLQIFCEYKSVMQSLLNLMNNAIHAVSKMDEKWIKIVIDTNEGMIQFKFIDSGSGIDPKMVDKIMQPFFTTKEIGEGLGMGLSIAFNVAYKHAGKLYVDKEARHTTIVFSLPIHQAKLKAA